MSHQRSPIEYAVVGLGTWGDLHLRVLSKDPRVHIAAVCDINPERARAAAETYQVPAWYTTIDDLLADLSIEAISVATPDFAHAPSALAVLQARRHLLLEKPMATTIPECLDILKAAQQSSKTLMIDFHNRWSPPFTIARQRIQAGEMGKLRYCYFRLNDTIFVPTAYLPWAGKSSVLWFLGSHVTDTLRWMFEDEVREVYCVSRKEVLQEMGIDTPDFYTYILQFENGGVATVENSWIVSDKTPSIFDLKCEIQCSRGTIFIDTSHNRMLEIYSHKQAEGWENIYPDTSVNPTIHGKVIGLAAESIRHFIDCVWTGQPPMVGGLDGLRSVEILSAVEESAVLNRPVSVKKHHL
jgi:predicted dehydrogenase